MRTSFKTREVSVFTKILFFFIIVIFPLYIFSIQINIRGQNDVRKEIVDSTKSKINFYIESLEKDFDNIIKMQSGLMTNEHLQKLNTTTLDKDAFESYQSMNAVRDKLRELKDMNAYIKGCAVFLPSAGKKITDSSVEDIDMTEYNRFKAATTLEAFPFSTIDGHIYMNITSALYAPDLGQVTDSFYIISLEVSREKLTSVLKQFVGSADGGAVLIGDNRGLNIIDESSIQVQPYVHEFLNEKNKLGEKSGGGTIKAGGRRYFVSYEKSTRLHTTLLVYIPEEKLLESLTRYRSLLWFMSVATVIAVVLFTLWVKGMVVKPLDKLIKAFKRVEEGELNISVEYSGNDEFSYLYRQFNDMFNRLRLLIEQVYEQRIRVQNAELKQLQYQINPHFLYNCIFNIYRMAKMNDNESIMRLTHHLGNYYQFVTRSSADEIPLDREVNHAKDYVEIQTIRFSDRILVDFGEIPENCKKLNVPRLIIQPVIENAYNHGLKSKLNGGKLKISFERINNLFKIIVEDNGEEMDDDSLKELESKLSTKGQNIESTGLINVHRRLQIKYGENSGIFVARSKLGGLLVEIRVFEGEAINHVQTSNC